MHLFRMGSRANHLSKKITGPNRLTQVSICHLLREWFRQTESVNSWRNRHLSLALLQQLVAILKPC